MKFHINILMIYLIIYTYYQHYAITVDEENSWPPGVRSTCRSCSEEEEEVDQVTTPWASTPSTPISLIYRWEIDRCPANRATAIVAIRWDVTIPLPPWTRWEGAPNLPRQQVGIPRSSLLFTLNSIDLRRTLTPVVDVHCTYPTQHIANARLGSTQIPPKLTTTPR